MKRRIVAGMITAGILTALLLAAGCTSGTVPAQKSPGDALLMQGEHKFSAHNYLAAGRLFALAQENYSAAGDPTPALHARDRVTTAAMITFPFPLNRSGAEAQVAAAFPGQSAEERAALLDTMKVTTLTTDGEVMYASETVNNIWFHNPSLMHAKMAAMNRTPFYDDLTPLIFSPMKGGTGTWGEPVTWAGVGEVAIPRDTLPKTGTFRLWMPVPIATGSQTNVTIVSAEPARYVKSQTGTGAEIGIVYFEIPLAEYPDPFLNVTVKFRFAQHEQRFTIDPANVRPYNTTDPLYRKYTQSGANIVLTPAMKKKALEIVGNETNPYLQAQKIYGYIVNTYPYSHAPHSWLDATRTPEAEYMLETGIGDCGTQSMYFAALCRSLGIPARAPGGYQMVEGYPGTHFWAEYYLEGYGWIPADVTVAEGADWSYNATQDERQRYKAYFSQNLDPYRYIIQNDVDIPLVPAVSRLFTNDMAFQEPRAECDTCTDDPIFWITDFWKLTITKE